MHKRCKSLIGVLCCSLICANTPMVFAGSSNGVASVSNVKEVKVGDTLLSAPVVATIATIAVGAGITLTTNDDIYDIARLVYDNYQGEKEDIENIFNSCVSIGKDGVVKVGKEFLDICKNSFDIVFTKNDSVGVNDISFKYGFPVCENLWEGTWGDFSDSLERHNLIPGYGVDCSKLEVGEKVYFANSNYYMTRPNSNYWYVYKTDTNALVSDIEFRTNGNTILNYKIYYKQDMWMQSYTYSTSDGKIITSGSNGLSYINSSTATYLPSYDIPYISGSYNWGNVSNNVDGRGNLSIYVPSNTISLVGQLGGSTIKDGLNTPLYDLIVDGVVEMPTVSNPSISVDTSSTFPLPGGNYKTPVTLNQEATILDVVVPLSFPVNVDNKGVVTVADNVEVVNNSIGPIKISDISIQSKDDWALSDFDKDYSAERVGLKEFSFKIEGQEISDSITLNKVVNGLDKCSIDYDSRVAPQKDSISDSNIADIVLTIDWYEN